MLGSLRPLGLIASDHGAPRVTGQMGAVSHGTIMTRRPRANVSFRSGRCQREIRPRIGFASLGRGLARMASRSLRGHVHPSAARRSISRCPVGGQRCVSCRFTGDSLHGWTSGRLRPHPCPLPPVLLVRAGERRSLRGGEREGMIEAVGSPPPGQRRTLAGGASSTAGGRVRDGGAVGWRRMAPPPATYPKNKR